MPHFRHPSPLGVLVSHKGRQLALQPLYELGVRLRRRQQHTAVRRVPAGRGKGDVVSTSADRAADIHGPTGVSFMLAAAPQIKTRP